MASKEISAVEGKRTKRCPGCKIPLEEHHWGIPSTFCDGEEKSSPKKALKKEQTESEGDTLKEMRQCLRALEIEEQELEKQELEGKIQQKRASIDERRKASQTLQGAASSTSPLDELLSNENKGLRTQHLWLRQPEYHEEAGAGTSAITASEMFLKPAKAANGEMKAYLIPDFVDSLIPQEHEETLSSQGTARISVTYGPKKPKLESITLQQWVVGNTRIFYTLLAEGKLRSMTDIQHYLAYTVKIMELANKYEWKSVVLYDNEFRRMQATYHYPWSFDSNHLHTVMLTPQRVNTNSPTKGPSNQARSNFANTNVEGKIMCRNFNSPRGCTFRDCNYVHECNRKVNGKACGLAHAGHAHNSPNTQS